MSVDILKETTRSFNKASANKYLKKLSFCFVLALHLKIYNIVHYIITLEPGYCKVQQLEQTEMY
jgi:hypothetical protein